MKAKIFTAVFAVAILALVPLALCEDSEAAFVYGFDNFTVDDKGGSVSFYVDDKDEVPLTAVISIIGSGKIVGNTTFIPDSNHFKVTVGIVSGLGQGDYNVKLVLSEEGSELETVTAMMHVNKNIWSGWIAYAALIVIGVIVVIGFFLHFRNRPKIKADTSFTEIETGKKEYVPSTPASTERKRYDAGASSQKTEAAEPVKKEAPKKKESKPSTGPTKYKSARRK